MDPAISIFVYLAFAALFASALVHKIGAFSRFVAAVADYRIVPQPLAAPVALCIVVAEIGAVVALVLMLPQALLIAAGLLMIYAFAMSLNLLRGRGYIGCGCGVGDERASVSWALVMRNVFLSIGALGLSRIQEIFRALTWLDWLSVFAGLIVAAMLYAITDALLVWRERETRL